MKKRLAMKINVYEFKDNSNGEVFTGTIEDYCVKEGVARGTLGSRVARGRISRKLIGRKEIGRGSVPYVFKEVATGRTFVGYYSEVCREWNMSLYKLKQYIELKSIIVNKVGHLNKRVYSAEPERAMSKLERKIRRQEVLKRAQMLDAEKGEL